MSEVGSAKTDCPDLVVSDLNNDLAPSVLKTSQEISQAIADYKAADRYGDDLIQLWQSIREAALMQFAHDGKFDSVAGAESY
jgi:hypothetical protein